MFNARATTFSLLAVVLFICLLPAVSRAASANGGGRFDTSAENIGGLRLGMSETDIPALLACAPNKLKERYEGATGEYVQTWNYPECGISLKMSSDKRGGVKSIASIKTTSACTQGTGKGIKAGSTEEEAYKAYGRFKDRDGATLKGKRFVAGSIYDGLIFEIKNGKVAGMFLGAAAE